MSYPTKEQALSAAFGTSDVGDEVIEHQADCIRDADDEGYCTCEFIVWRRTRDGWCEVPA